MSGPGAVVALVMLEWTAGWLGVAAWTQSWEVVRRGHFRILAWGAVSLGVLALLASTAAEVPGDDRSTLVGLAGALVAAALAYLATQYARTDVPAVVVGAIGGAVGVVALVAGAILVEGLPAALGIVEVVAGAALLGAVTNGMLLGHWYLNQPGLKPWALGRLTTLALGATAAAAVTGIAAAGYLTDASTTGAVLGIPGFGESFGVPFFITWLALVGFTGTVVWMARRCIRIKSIQSATGLYYVAITTAGVSEFLLRYLMVNTA